MTCCLQFFGAFLRRSATLVVGVERYKRASSSSSFTLLVLVKYSSIICFFLLETSTIANSTTCTVVLYVQYSRSIHTVMEERRELLLPRPTAHWKPQISDSMCLFQLSLLYVLYFVEPLLRYRYGRYVQCCTWQVQAAFKSFLPPSFPLINAHPRSSLRVNEYCAVLGLLLWCTCTCNDQRNLYQQRQQNK